MLKDMHIICIKSYIIALNIFLVFFLQEFYKKFNNTINLFNYNHLSTTCAIKHVTKLKN